MPIGLNSQPQSAAFEYRPKENNSHRPGDTFSSQYSAANAIYTTQRAEPVASLLLRAARVPAAPPDPLRLQGQEGVKIYRVEHSFVDMGPASPFVEDKMDPRDPSTLKRPFYLGRIRSPGRPARHFPVRYPGKAAQGGRSLLVLAAADVARPAGAHVEISRQKLDGQTCRRSRLDLQI